MKLIDFLKTDIGTRSEIAQVSVINKQKQLLNEWVEQPWVNEHIMKKCLNLKILDITIYRVYTETNSLRIGILLLDKTKTREIIHRECNHCRTICDFLIYNFIEDKHICSNCEKSL